MRMAVWRSAFLQRCHAVHGHLGKQQRSARVVRQLQRLLVVRYPAWEVQRINGIVGAYGITETFWDMILGDIHWSTLWLFIFSWILVCCRFFPQLSFKVFVMCFFTNNLTLLSWVWVEDAARGFGWFFDRTYADLELPRGCQLYSWQHMSTSVPHPVTKVWWLWIKPTS